MKSRGCREHWRTTENAQDEFLCNIALRSSKRYEMHVLEHKS